VASAAGVGSASAVAAGAGVFPLTVSSDGRYLKQANGTPFLICGTSAWEIGVNIPIAGLNSYLNTITSQGFNCVLMEAIAHCFTLVKPPKERGGLLPFTQRLDGSAFTGSPNGTTGANGTQGQFAADNYSNINTQAADWTFINNSYWQVIESVLDACEQHSVAVFTWPAYIGFHAGQEGWMQEMVVLDGIIGAGGFVGQSFANPTKSKLWNYGAWLANRWKNRPNIIWVMGGDYGANTQTLSTAERAAVTSVMAGMKSVAGQQSLLWTAHWDRPCLATDTNLTAGSWDMNFCYSDDSTAELCRRGYAVTPAIPSLLGEYNYEQGLFGGSAPWRKYLWWGFLAGISGGFFGHEQAWRFDDGTPGTDYTTILATQGTLDASRQFAFLKSRPWHRLKPSGLGGMGALITAGGGTASPQSTTYVAAAATPEGDLLVAYVPPDHTGSITVDMTKLSATAQARWFDPANATFTNAGAFANSGTHAFSTPGANSAGDADWVLLLETVSGASSASATVLGVGASIAASAGVATATSGASAVGAAMIAAVGSATGASTASGNSTTVLTATASSSGASTAAAVANPLGSGAGASAGVGTAAAVPAFRGVTSGTSTATAVGSSLASCAAASSGTGAAQAVGAAQSSCVGVAAGLADATAVGAGPSAGSGTGTTAGASTAAAVGMSLAATTGIASGIAVAAATAAAASAAGTSTGTAAAAAVGRSIWDATAVAAGTSVAVAFYATGIELTGFAALVATMDTDIIELLG
jgi:hypothetical protein